MALLLAIALWTMGILVARFLSTVIFLSYVTLTALSLLAFFGFMSTVQHSLEREAIIQSSEYERIETALDRTELKLEQLARYADPSQVQSAQAALSALQPRIQTAQNQLAHWQHPDGTVKTNSRGQPYTTKANEAQAALNAIKAEQAPHQKIIDNYADYNGMLANKERLLSEKSQLSTGSISGHGGIHPMFINLGELIDVTPQKAKIGFMVISATAAELLGSLLVLIGFVMGRKRSFTIDEIEALSSSLNYQQERLKTALGHSENFPQTPRLTHKTSQTEAQPNPPAPRSGSGEPKTVWQQMREKTIQSPDFDFNGFKPATASATASAVATDNRKPVVPEVDTPTEERRPIGFTAGKFEVRPKPKPEPNDSRLDDIPLDKPKRRNDIPLPQTTDAERVETATDDIPLYFLNGVPHVKCAHHECNAVFPEEKLHRYGKKFCGQACKSKYHHTAKD